MTIEKGKLNFVGVGSAGTEFITLQTIEVIKQADVIFAPTFVQNAIKECLKDKDVRIAWPDIVYKVGNEPYTRLDTEEEKNNLAKLYANIPGTWLTNSKKKWFRIKRWFCLLMVMPASSAI